jgi:LPS export ABC transporter protein LptC
MMLQQPRVWLVILAVLATVTWWLTRDGQPRNGTLVDRPDAPVGFYMRGARLIGLDEQGQVVYRMSATFGTQEEAQGPIRLEEVVVDYQPAADVPWRIESRRAEVAADLNRILMFDGVVATSTGDDTPPAVVRTDSLALDHATQIASTRDPVSIETPDGTLSGVGMTAWLREDRLRLEADVNGRFVP